MWLLFFHCLYISKWNKEVFGKLDTRRTKALEDLAALDHSSEGRDLTVE